MGHEKNQKELTAQSAAGGAVSSEQTVDVLYQKMGDRWFAFSMIDDEVFVGSISQKNLDGGRQEPASSKSRGTRGTKTYKITGNS